MIVHDGLTGAQPISLFGILYHQNNATTGTWLNLNRATYPVELATPASTATIPRSCPATCAWPSTKCGNRWASTR